MQGCLCRLLGILKMKSPWKILATLFLCLTHSFGQAPKLPPQQAEILRSLNGKGIDAAGFGNIPTPLKKGMTYDVVKQGVGQVTLDVDGRKVIVPSRDVLISDKPAATQAAPGVVGFVPGKLLVLSAKYTLAGNQPRNVKNRVEKLIPAGDLARPVEILVSDQLSMAAQNQGDGSQNVVVIATPELVAIALQNTLNPPNVLTIEYMFNGQRMMKQGIEGTKIVLP